MRHASIGRVTLVASLGLAFAIITPSCSSDSSSDEPAGETGGAAGLAGTGGAASTEKGGAAAAGKGGATTGKGGAAGAGATGGSAAGTGAAAGTTAGTAGSGAAAGGAAGAGAAGAGAAGASAGGAAGAGATTGCGYNDQGTPLHIATDLDVCLPPVICTSETCPPPLGTCVNGACQFKPGYEGLKTLGEGWVTYYCTLSTGGCHGVTQIDFPEKTAADISKSMGIPLCEDDPTVPKCVGIAASSPMLVGNSQVAKDPSTGQTVGTWGQGLTEASGLCYELSGPGGSVLVALTDRCGGYCSCGGSGFQECGPCVSAPDMMPNCPCVGTAPSLYTECCGEGCGGALKADCDWCASNNHPHFDLDTGAFNKLCAGQANQGSCKLTGVKPVPCVAPSAWPPGGGGGTCKANSFSCTGPMPSQPQVPGTNCCCNFGLNPLPDGSCG